MPKKPRAAAPGVTLLARRSVCFWKHAGRAPRRRPEHRLVRLARSRPPGSRFVTSYHL